MSQTADLQTRLTSQMIARGGRTGVGVTTRTIGRGGTYRNAVEAATALRFGHGLLFDVIHTWDTPSLLGGCGSPSPVIYSPAVAPGGAPAWLKQAMVYRNGTAIANSEHLLKRLIHCGAPAYRCNVIQPVVDFERVLGGRNEALREALGIRSDDFVVLAPGESTRAARHLLALHTMSILRVLHPRFRLLIWGEGPGVGTVNRMAQAFIDPRVLVIAERELGHPVEFQELFGASDAALWTAAAKVPPLPLALSMAAGLPIVATNGPVVGELLRDDNAAVIIPGLSPRLLARAVLQLFEEPQFARKLGETAGKAARQRFDPRLTVGQFMALYRRAAGVSPKGATVAPGFESDYNPEVSVLPSR